MKGFIMKRFFAFLIALMLLISFAGCGQETENSELPGETENNADEENTAFYEEILLNFGATRRHDGSLIVSRKGSFYDLRDRLSDCSNLTPDTYYTWVASRTENSDKVKVVLSGFDSEVYAYSADFYENEVTKFFDVTAEDLRKGDFYYPEQNCYYCETVPAAGEYVDIDFVSAEENGEELTIDFTLTDSINGTTNHSLTVKLLSEGGYNYVSYIAK